MTGARSSTPAPGAQRERWAAPGGCLALASCAGCMLLHLAAGWCGLIVDGWLLCRARVRCPAAAGLLPARCTACLLASRSARPTPTGGLGGRHRPSVPRPAGAGRSLIKGPRHPAPSPCPLWHGWPGPEGSNRFFCRQPLAEESIRVATSSPLFVASCCQRNRRALCCCCCCFVADCASYNHRAASRLLGLMLL